MEKETLIKIIKKKMEQEMRMSDYAKAYSSKEVQYMHQGETSAYYDVILMLTDEKYAEDQEEAYK